MAKSKKLDSKVDITKMPKVAKIKEEEIHIIPRGKSWTYEHKALGEYHSREEGGIIYVNKEGNGFEVVDTILHETLHACCDKYKLNLHPKTEERIVATLSSGLSNALLYSPELLNFIYKELKKQIKLRKSEEQTRSED